MAGKHARADAAPTVDEADLAEADLDEADLAELEPPTGLPAPSGEPSDPAPAQRLNRVIAEKMLQGRTYNFLAAPVAGSTTESLRSGLALELASGIDWENLKNRTVVLFCSISTQACWGPHDLEGNF